MLLYVLKDELLKVSSNYRVYTKQYIIIFYFVTYIKQAKEKQKCLFEDMKLDQTSRMKELIK